MSDQAINFYDNNTPPQPDIEIVSGGVNFSFLKSGDSNMPNIPEPPDETTAVSKRRGRPPKPRDENGNIIRADSAEVVTSVLDEYRETNNLIRQTINEVDTLSVELKEEMDNIRSSRTLKNKYMYLTNLSSNIGALLGTKIQAIKELNSVIKNATDFDYKKQKDMAIANGADTDQQIYNLYNAFVNSPISSGPSSLGPSTAQMSIAGTPNIIRADSTATSPLDVGYQNFQSTMTPEQRMIVMEDQIKQVIVYDKATGQKYFDVVDLQGNSVPGVPRRDPMFLQDFTIDTRTKTARSVNLNESIPLVILNEDKSFDEY